MVVIPPAGRGAPAAKRPGPQRRAGLISTQGWTWRQWLALGLCFGLGHGITARLLNLRAEDGPAGRQNFGVQPFPGTSLEELRRRHGGQAQPLRTDLEAIEQDRRIAREKAQMEERRGDLERQQPAEQPLGGEETGQTGRAASDRQAPPMETPAPLPAPEPLPAAPAEPPAPPAAGPALPPLPEAPPAPSPATQR